MGKRKLLKIAVFFIYISFALVIGRDYLHDRSFLQKEKQAFPEYDIKRIPFNLFNNSKNMSVDNQGQVELISNGDDARIIINKSEIKRLSIKDITMNGEAVTLSNKFSNYRLEEKPDKLIIIPKYSIKPSVLNFKISNNNFNATIPIHVVYVFDSKKDTLKENMWFQIPDQWAKQADDGLILPANTNVKLKQFGFDRSFEKNIEMEFEFEPLGEPLLLSIFLSQETSIILGEENIRSVKLKQTKKDGLSGKRDVVVQKSKYGPGFVKGNKYSVLIRRVDNTYSAYISQAGLAQEKVISFKDEDFKNNINAKYKSLSFGLWKKSKGIMLNKIKIKAEDT